MKHALQTRTHTHKKKKKTSFTTVSSIVYLVPLIFSFRPWVPDQNMNKSLEPMSEIPCKYLLHSKSSFNSLYTVLMGY